ncbi:MAG: hypothetical protein JWO38_5097 [Gemmataceae bacterium]|nr:hypothetical protein [Gemmataceae bacterium]
MRWRASHGVPKGDSFQYVVEKPEEGMGLDTLPNHLKQAVDDELIPGEQLVWVGQPGPKPFDWRVWASVGFGLEWTAIALLWTTLATLFELNGGHDDKPVWFRVFFPLFGVPFVLLVAVRKRSVSPYNGL